MIELRVRSRKFDIHPLRLVRFFKLNYKTILITPMMMILIDLNENIIEIILKIVYHWEDHY